MPAITASDSDSKRVGHRRTHNTAYVTPVTAATTPAIIATTGERVGVLTSATDINTNAPEIIVIRTRIATPNPRARR